jgi:beta-lactamase regulating signal transducer with metallopeptidase domain
MNFSACFGQPLWFQLGLTLVHFLWQGTVIAVFIWAAVHLYELRHGSPRYTAYLLGLGLMVAAPVATFAILHTADVTSFSQTTPKKHRIAFNVGNSTVPSGEGDIVVLEIAVPPQPRPVSRVGLIAKGCLTKCRYWIDRAIPWCLVCWVAGVLILSTRLLLGHYQTRVWRSHASPLPEDLLMRTQQLAGRFGFKKFKAVFCSDHVHEAMAVGILRPVILVPVSWVTHMCPDMLEAIIAHELAHIRRHDLWVNLVQRIVETLFFYHPAVWWMSKCIRQEREYCCDQIAADMIAGRATYASALHRAGQLTLSASHAMAMGLGAHSSRLLDRVRCVLGVHGSERHRHAWLAGLVCLAVMGLFVVPPVAALAGHSIRAAMVQGSDHGDVLNRLLQEEPMDSQTLWEIYGATANHLERPDLLAVRGIAGYRLQQFQAAEESLTRVLQTTREDSKLHIQCSFFLARTYQATNRLEKSLRLFETCLRLDKMSGGLTESQRLQARKCIYELTAAQP